MTFNRKAAATSDGFSKEQQNDRPSVTSVTSVTKLSVSNAAGNCRLKLSNHPCDTRDIRDTRLLVSLGTQPQGRECYIPHFRNQNAPGAVLERKALCCRAESDPLKVVS
jgi:hypothetical protein